MAANRRHWLFMSVFVVFYLLAGILGELETVKKEEKSTHNINKREVRFSEGGTWSNSYTSYRRPSLPLVRPIFATALRVGDTCKTSHEDNTTTYCPEDTRCCEQNTKCCSVTITDSPWGPVIVVGFIFLLILIYVVKYGDEQKGSSETNKPLLCDIEDTPENVRAVGSIVPATIN